MQLDTRQCAVSVTVVNDGPQAELDWLRVRLIFVGLLTEVRSVAESTGGAHLNDSATLPELAVPALPENWIATGFADHNALGEVLDANPTEA